MELVTNPTAHLSTNPRDVYNNILLFIVKEDKKRGRSLNPTEMHIFQVAMFLTMWEFLNNLGVNFASDVSILWYSASIQFVLNIF